MPEPTSYPPRHRDVDEILTLADRWQIMWRVDVPDIGRITCYGAPRCIVHFMDYIHGGWDVYVPANNGLDIQTTVDALQRVAVLGREGPDR